MLAWTASSARLPMIMITRFDPIPRWLERSVPLFASRGCSVRASAHSCSLFLNHIIDILTAGGLDDASLGGHSGPEFHLRFVAGLFMTKLADDMDVLPLMTLT